MLTIDFCMYKNNSGETGYKSGNWSMKFVAPDGDEEGGINFITEGGFN